MIHFSIDSGYSRNIMQYQEELLMMPVAIGVQDFSTLYKSYAYGRCGCDE